MNTAAVIQRPKFKSELDVLLDSKPCFGGYEDGDNSWHCKGCILKSKCINKKNEGNLYDNT